MNPYLYPPPVAPFPPRPCPPFPPPPARHPGLYEDMDGYTRKEVDDADARTLASANAHTDSVVGDAATAAEAAAQSAAVAEGAVSGIVAAVSGIEGSVAAISGAAAAAEASAANAVELVEGAVIANNGCVVVGNELWYYSARSTSIGDRKWKKFKAKSSFNAGEFSLAPGNTISVFEGGVVIQKQFSATWYAEGTLSGTYFRAGYDSDAGAIRFYFFNDGAQGGSLVSDGSVFSPWDTIESDSKRFAKYHSQSYTGFHWTDAPYRVKLAGFENSPDHD